MPNTTRASHAPGATRKATTSSRPKAASGRHSRRTNPREVSVILASEADVLAALEASPPPDALPPPTMEVAALSMGLSSLVEQLRPTGRTALIDLPEELLLTIVERAFLASIADARPVERLAALAVTCRALRFLGSERCAEHLAHALYPASSLRVAARGAMPMWKGLSSVVEQLRRRRDPRESAAAPQHSALQPQAYPSWRSCLSHDNADRGVWCVTVEGLGCRARGSDGSYCEARLQAIALDLHDGVAEVVVLLDAAGDASALSRRMLHEARLDHRRWRGWASPVYRLLGPGRQVCEISFPADVLIDSAQHDAQQAPLVLESRAAPAETEGGSREVASADDGELWNFTLWAIKFKALRMGSRLARTTSELARLFRRIGTFQPLPLPYDAEARGPNSWGGLPAELLPQLRMNRGITWAVLGGQGGEGQQGRGEAPDSGGAPVESWRPALRSAWMEHMSLDDGASGAGAEAAHESSLAPWWAADPRFRCQTGWTRLDMEEAILSTARAASRRAQSNW